MTTRNRPAIVFATRSGGTTIDQDAFGGNPFATALIQLVSRPRVGLDQFAKKLRALTIEGSQRHQQPEWMHWPRKSGWSFRRGRGSRNERRCALVLIVSDYASSGSDPLLGAAHDEVRVSAMFTANGFSVTRGVAPDRAALVRALVAFRREARRRDVAVIYSTGHGVERHGRVYLLPGDYPRDEDYSPATLKSRAVPFDRIARACAAARRNFVFFAGCRISV